MKKILCLLLAVIIGCFVFAGCGNDKKDLGKESDPKNKTSSSDKVGDSTSTPDKNNDDKDSDDKGGDNNPSGGNGGSGNESSGGNNDNSNKDDDMLGSGVELPDDVWE